jgi:hypothetical protein
MSSFVKYSSIAALLLAGSALADATSYSPHATGFTLPNAQQAVTALSAQTSAYATTAGSTGYATSAGSANIANYATTAASAATATNAATASTANYATAANTANAAAYATNAGVASQAAELTAGDNCGAGTALTVTYGILGCVSSVNSITGQLNGAQIVGNLTVGSITATGNIISYGYTYGIGGLFTDNAVYANTYVDRNGGGSANFYGNASSANYAASSMVGILYQGQAGVSSSYYCDPGYYLKFYDTNVNSSNNAFFYSCIANGH